MITNEERAQLRAELLAELSQADNRERLAAHGAAANYIALPAAQRVEQLVREGKLNQNDPIAMNQALANALQEAKAEGQAIFASSAGSSEEQDRRAEIARRQAANLKTRGLA